MGSIQTKVSVKTMNIFMGKIGLSSNRIQQKEPP